MRKREDQVRILPISESAEVEDGCADGEGGGSGEGGGGGRRCASEASAETVVPACRHTYGRLTNGRPKTSRPRRSSDTGVAPPFR